MGKALYNSMLIHGYAVSSIATNLGQSRQAALIRKEQSVIAIPDIAPLIGLRFPHPGTPLLRNTKHAPPALRMRLQRSSAAGRVSAPIRTW